MRTVVTRSGAHLITQRTGRVGRSPRVDDEAGTGDRQFQRKEISVGVPGLTVEGARSGIEDRHVAAAVEASIAAVWQFMAPRRRPGNIQSARRWRATQPGV